MARSTMAASVLDWLCRMSCLGQLSTFGIKSGMARCLFPLPLAGGRLSGSGSSGTSTWCVLPNTRSISKSARSFEPPYEAAQAAIFSDRGTLSLKNMHAKPGVCLSGVGWSSMVRPFGLGRDGTGFAKNYTTQRGFDQQITA